MLTSTDILRRYSEQHPNAEGRGLLERIDRAPATLKSAGVKMGVGEQTFLEYRSRRTEFPTDAIYEERCLKVLFQYACNISDSRLAIETMAYLAGWAPPHSHVKEDALKELVVTYGHSNSVSLVDRIDALAYALPRLIGKGCYKAERAMLAALVSDAIDNRLITDQSRANLKFICDGIFRNEDAPATHYAVLEKIAKLAGIETPRPQMRQRSSSRLTTNPALLVLAVI